MSVYAVLVLVLVVAGVQSWTLRSSVDQVISGDTENVAIECRQDNTADVEGLRRLLISRKDSFGVRTSIAKVQKGVNGSEVETLNDDVIVSGHIGQADKTFLKVKWLKATPDTPGAYSCHISTFDDDNEFVDESVGPTVIKERLLTLDDVSKAIEEATSGLRSEIETLKRLINTDIEELKREILEQNEVIKSDSIQFQEDVNKNYVTKKDLARESSLLMIFTIKQIEQNKTDDELVHKELSKSITNLNKIVDSNISVIRSNLSLIQNESKQRIASLEKTQGNDIRQINSRIDQLEREDKSIAKNISISINSVRRDFERKLSLKKCTICPAPTPRTTTSTTTTTMKPPTIPSPAPWPGSAFALVRSESGCPSKDFRETGIIHSISRYIQILLQSLPGQSSPDGYCVHDKPNSSVKWSKGKYCILQLNNKACPSGFHSGTVQLELSAKGSKKIDVKGTVNKFCCRSDGSKKSKLKLPTENPFYLFRYKGKCQKVKDMNVKETTTRIVLGKTIRFDGKIKTHGTTPDLSSSNLSVTFKSCHYKK